MTHIFQMTDPYRAMCAELTDAELANAARKALDSYRYATELPYFLRENSKVKILYDSINNEYEPLMLAIRAAIAADRDRACVDRPTPQPPADGEVAKLVEWLQDCADVRNDEGYTSLGYQYFRAAELLKRYALPTPETTND